MTKSSWVFLVAGLILGASLFSMHGGLRAADAPAARVFEIRTYYTLPGRLDALNQRFRNHTMKLFEKHGMTNIGYWVPQDSPAHDNTLIYVIAHASREQAKANWAAFAADPEWKKVAEESQKDGKIIDKIDSVFVDATDYSPMK
jgi:hypothetical protein